MTFIDCNIQPNGRSADSSGPTHYLVSLFATIQVPKKDVAHSEERKRRSVVGELTVYKRKKGKGGCSNGSAHNWLKQFRPKVAICPHKLDYCDTCAKMSEDLRSKQTILKWLKQTGSVSEEEVHSSDNSIKELSLSLEEYKWPAQKSHKYHLEMVERCANQWKR